ncbi:hypothetical protein F4604DRAFT_1954189 [Suillus subluteus]|nr:hypothetical protein F4604DRAFT_1954189 [Suillus subluteus]
MSQAHTTSACPAQPCGGPDNDHDGCGVIFPQMSPENLLCQLCKKLKKQGLTDNEVLRLKETLKQCFQCGICGMHIGDPCRLCKRRAHEENGTSDPEAMALQARRRNIIEGHLHRPLGPSTPDQKPGSIDRTLGTYCAPYAETMTFVGTVFFSYRWSHILSNPCSPAVQESVVKLVNPKWISKHVSDLLVETELRVRGNLVLSDSGIGIMSLCDWYNKYNHPQTRASHIQVPVGALKGNKSGRVISLELFIDTDQYEERTCEDHSGSGDKRKSMSSGQPRAKCVCGHGAVTEGQSSAAKWLRNDENSTVLTSSFRRDLVTTCAPSGTAEQGFLAHNALFLSAADHGKTKDVHLLVIENKEYVAKKLVDISHGHGQLTIKDACKFLTTDLICLKQMSYFETKFAQHVIQEGVDTAAFQVSDGFVIKTYCSNVDQVDAELQAPICKEVPAICKLTSIYLVEPHRVSSAVLKFSGTLGIHNCTDKRSATIMAFSHFVLESSTCEYMFADLQASLSVPPKLRRAKLRRHQDRRILSSNDGRFHINLPLERKRRHRYTDPPIFALERMKTPGLRVLTQTHMPHPMPHIYHEFNADPWNSIVVLRHFLLALQKPTIEELPDEDTRCDTRSLALAQCLFSLPAVFPYLTAHDILTCIVFMVL